MRFRSVNWPASSCPTIAVQTPVRAGASCTTLPCPTSLPPLVISVRSWSRKALGTSTGNTHVRWLKIFPTLCTSANDHQSAMSIKFGVTNLATRWMCKYKTCKQWGSPVSIFNSTPLSFRLWLTKGADKSNPNGSMCREHHVYLTFWRLERFSTSIMVLYTTVSHKARG